MADSDKDRQRRMNEALDKIHAKNNSPEAKAKRAEKAAKLRRNQRGEN